MFAALRRWRPLLFFLAGLVLYLAGAVVLWERLGPQPRYTLPAGCFPACGSADGRLLVTAQLRWDSRFGEQRACGPVQVWDLARGAEIVSVLNETQIVFPWALSPDARWLAVREGLYDKLAKLHVFALPSGEERAVYPMPANQTWFACRFAPDSGTLAVATGKPPQGSITLLDPAGAQPPRVLEGVTYPFAFAPDGQLLAATVAGGTGPRQENTGEVRLLDPATGALRGSLRPRLGTIIEWPGLLFAPDGKTLVVSYQEPPAYGVALWDVAEQREKAWIDSALSPQFLADGKSLVMQHIPKGGPYGILLVDATDPDQRTPIHSKARLQLAHSLMPYPPQFVTYETHRPPFYPFLPDRTALELRQPRTGEVMASFRAIGLCGPVYSPDGSSLLVCSYPRQQAAPIVAVWDLPIAAHPGRQAAGVAGLTAVFGIGLWLLRRRRRAKVSEARVAP